MYLKKNSRVLTKSFLNNMNIIHVWDGAITYLDSVLCAAPVQWQTISRMPVYNVTRTEGAMKNTASEEPTKKWQSFPVTHFLLPNVCLRISTTYIHIRMWSLLQLRNPIQMLHSGTSWKSHSLSCHQHEPGNCFLKESHSFGC